MAVIVKKNELIQARIMKGYSQRELAKLVGLSSAQISFIENSKRNPSPYSAKKICEALEVKFGDIFYIRNRKDK